MNFFEAFHQYYLIALGFVLSSIVLWFALALIRKGSGKWDWGMMLAGTLLITFNAFSITIVILIEEMSWYGVRPGALHWHSLDRHVMSSTFTISLAAGLLLFTIGFLLHASRSCKARNRFKELELTIRSLEEEIENLRNR